MTENESTGENGYIEGKCVMKSGEMHDMTMRGNLDENGKGQIYESCEQNSAPFS